MHNQGWYLGAEPPSAERAAPSVRIAARRRCGLHHRAEIKRGLFDIVVHDRFFFRGTAAKSRRQILRLLLRLGHTLTSRALLVSLSRGLLTSAANQSTCEPRASRGASCVDRCFPSLSLSWRALASKRHVSIRRCSSTPR